MARKATATTDQALGAAGSNPSGSYSIALWWRPTNAASTGTRKVVTWGDGTAEGGFSWDNGGASFQQAWYHKNTSAGFPVAKYTTTLVAGTRYHCGATYDGSDLRAYLNGAVETTSAAGAPQTSATAKWAIGVANLATHQAPAGEVAEVAVWTVALSDSELAALAKGISPRLIRPLSLIRYWPLFGVGSPEPDYSGNVDNLTLTGFTTLADNPSMMAPFGADTWPRYRVTSGVTVTPGVVALSSSALAPLAVDKGLPGLVSLAAGIQTATPALQATPAATFLGLAEPAPRPIVQVLPPAVGAAVALPAPTPVRQALPTVVGLGLAAPVAIPTVVVLPGAVALAVALPAITVAIVGDVTATPAAVALAAGLPAATPIVQARPAAVALTQAQLAAAPSVQALPASLALGLTLPAASASGQVDDPIALDLTDAANIDDPIALDLTDEVAVGNIVATPGAVSLSIALPALTPRLALLPALVAVSTAEPVPIPSLQAQPAAPVLSASLLTATPALSVLPAAVAVTTATPALLAVVIRALPFGPGLAVTTLSPTSSSGTTVVPSLVTLALALPAALPVLRAQPGLVALNLSAVTPQGQLVVFPALVGLLLATPAALGAKAAIPAVVALLVAVRQPTTIGYGGGGQAGAGISYETVAAPLGPRYQAQSDPLRRTSYESTADALR